MGTQDFCKVGCLLHKLQACLIKRMDRGIDTSTAAAFSSRAAIDLRRNFERLIALFLITHLSQGADIVSGEIRHTLETLEIVDIVEPEPGSMDEPLC